MLLRSVDPGSFDHAHKRGVTCGLVAMSHGKFGDRFVEFVVIAQSGVRSGSLRNAEARCQRRLSIF
jgi:hypothetical protein